MAIGMLHDDPNTMRSAPATVPTAGAIVFLVAGMTAAWLAAGSTGLLAVPLQHAMTWLALVVAVAAIGVPDVGRFGAWAILASGAAAGLLFTASSISTVNVLAVAVVLAATAQVHRGLTGRLAKIAAMAVLVFACFRLACDAIPWFGGVIDTVEAMFGRFAIASANRELDAGARYSGIDFLVLTAAVYAGWLFCTPSPRRRAIGIAAAILAGHITYLILLAHSEMLIALLPPAAKPEVSDIDHVGLWTWGNGLRTLVPWNMPLLAVAFYVTIVALMVRSGPWLPVVELSPLEMERKQAKEKKEDIPGSVLAADMLFRFGPSLLAATAALLLCIWTGHGADLRGKKVVAYEGGDPAVWKKPSHDSTEIGRYGMLPALVESLGGTFALSKNLSENEIAGADVLLLIRPGQTISPPTLDRALGFARRGGSLLQASEPAARRKIAEGGDRGVVGFSDDSVSVVEQSLGRGQMATLADASFLSNERLVAAYASVGRLLGRLARPSSDSRTLGLQFLAIAALVASVSLMVRRPAAWQIAATSTVMATVLVCATAAGRDAGRVLPDGRLRAASPGGVNNVAYIDASHLEAYDGRSASPLGIGTTLRALMRQGYLPLLAPDLAADRLERAGLLLLIAPAREFSAAERATLHSFVSGGGTLICTVGAEESRPIAPLLAAFQFRVPYSPVPPDENATEPEPLGAKQGSIDRSDSRYMFYAAWPVECNAAGVQLWSAWTEGENSWPVVASCPEREGTVVVIGDTHFAVNKNQETAESAGADNGLFWRWLLTRVMPGQKPWSPPPSAAAAADASDGESVKEEGVRESKK